MFALAVEYLTGRAVATAFDDRERPEWPPHPARLFFALAAAMFEGALDATELHFLEWLEKQDAPCLAVGDANERFTPTTYVPVNDSRVPRRPPARPGPDHLGVLPECRPRQPRTFPSVSLEDPVAYFLWPQAELTESCRRIAAQLVAKVAYIGHSSSLVRVRLCDDPPPATYVPVDEGQGDIVLRVPVEGQLSAIEQAHRVYVDTGIRGALPCAFRAYRRVHEDGSPAVRDSVFADLVIFRRREGPSLPLEATEMVTAALREAVMTLSDQPVPEALSGHRLDGGKSERPHVAFVALADVGHPYADGHLLGVAVVLPRSLAGEERRAVLRALGRVERLTMGAAGIWSLERVTPDAVQRGLRAETWVEPSRRWATVTPVELDAFPSEPYGLEAEEIVATSCERIGLPRPHEVVVIPNSIVPGAPPWHRFHRSRRPSSRPRRPLVHVVVTFAGPVRGPVILGAGRYRGLGLCRPIRWSEPLTPRKTESDA